MSWGWTVYLTIGAMLVAKEFVYDKPGIIVRMRGIMDEAERQRGVRSPTLAAVVLILAAVLGALTWIVFVPAVVYRVGKKNGLFR